MSSESSLLERATHLFYHQNEPLSEQDVRLFHELRPHTQPFVTSSPLSRFVHRVCEDDLLRRRGQVL
jgi:hypothetical protein